VSAASESPCQGGPPGDRPIPSDVARRAVEWLVELQDETTAPTVREEWARWKEAHPDHERAWQRIEGINGRLHGMSSPVKSAITHATLAPPESNGRRHAIKALAILIFAGGAAWLAEDKMPWRTWTADFRTDRGERRTVDLADGTQLVLNTDSAVNILFDSTERRIRLVAGEILVTTAPDPQAVARPFLVESAQGQAKALGTRYAVRQLPDATEVSVFKGAVEIRPNESDIPPLVLRAGQRVSFTSRKTAAPRLAEEGSAAWTDGLIVARSMRLIDFLADLGRYSADPLSCDPAVADLRVSGSYPLGDIPRVLDALSATFDLEVQTMTRFWGQQIVRVTLAPRRKSS